MADSVRIFEMGPRDGLQNEKTPVSVANRIAFIRKLFGAREDIEQHFRGAISLGL